MQQISSILMVREDKIKRARFPFAITSTFSFGWAPENIRAVATIHHTGKKISHPFVIINKVYSTARNHSDWYSGQVLYILFFKALAPYQLIVQVESVDTYVDITFLLFLASFKTLMDCSRVFCWTKDKVRIVLFHQLTRYVFVGKQESKTSS